jgi:hypothetical protein
VNEGLRTQVARARMNAAKALLSEVLDEQMLDGGVPLNIACELRTFFEGYGLAMEYVEPLEELDAIANRAPTVESPPHPEACDRCRARQDEYEVFLTEMDAMRKRAETAEAYVGSLQPWVRAEHLAPCSEGATEPTPRERIAAYGPGERVSVNAFVSYYFKNPSFARSELLEMQEEGLLRLDDEGVITRLRTASAAPNASDSFGWLDHFYRRHRPGDAPRPGDALLAYDLVTYVRMRDGRVVPWTDRHQGGS